ncbi:type II toxin-antitoxin system HicB family antitoxin [Dentiradicibacter hellwigii]|uniref:Type II toxin-antitoxin system HicB family antitoxin n=1 Tax=Dentiradicibacter hellwigii TaxID=3149053 RepID=A0ABV4UCK7_9RHOO
MLYPVYIYPGDANTAHGIVFPDFPGCHAAADEWEHIPAMCQEAVEAHFAGEPATAVPAPSPLSELQNNPEYTGGVWMLADIDLGKLQSAPVRLNISLPANLVRQIDGYANKNGMTRSGFLAKAASMAMAD